MRCLSSKRKKTVLVSFFWAKQFYLSAKRLLINCSHLTAEESDSDSDEDLEGGVRHDLMMADEKVHCTWWCKNQNLTKECARQWLNNVEWQNSPAHVINNLALAIGLQKTSLLCHRNIPYLTTIIPMCPTAYVTGLSEVAYYLSEANISAKVRLVDLINIKTKG